MAANDALLNAEFVSNELSTQIFPWVVCASNVAGTCENEPLLLPRPAFCTHMLAVEPTDGDAGIDDERMERRVPVT